MDMARVSACSYPMKDRSLQEALDVISAAGFKKVDLLGHLPHLSLDPAEWDPEKARAAARARGLRIANLATYVGKAFSSDDPFAQEQELAQASRAIDLAAFFGSRSIRVSAGNDDPACIDRIVPWFKLSSRYAAENQVYMGFETHGGGISGKPTLCRELAEKVGSPFFGVLYDPCNLMQDGTDYRLALWTMRDHIVHVHLKDGAVTSAGFARTMMGEGQIDFSWIVQQVDALGYGGDLAVEYELTTEAPETGLKKWYSWMLAM